MNSPRFNRAVSALVGAYLNDTLESTDCHACAVGNIVAAGYGEVVERVGANRFVCRVKNDAWAAIFLGGDMVSDPTGDPEYSKGLENIGMTGYTARDLAKVEYAFMFPYNNDLSLMNKWDQLDESDRTYQRLMACVDVLCEIEGITDAVPYKAQFDRSLPLPVLD